LVRIVALFVCVVSGSASANIIWQGNFETGDRSQWSGAQMVSPDRLQIVQAPSPVREGRYAIKVTVRQGDDPIHSGGNRNELFYNSYDPLGSEYFYAWSTMFDSSFPSYPSWQLFTQWHQQADCCGSPPVQFYVNGETVYLEIGGNGRRMWSTPLVRGVWYDFVFHVKWSDNPNVGFVELYLNGDLVLPRMMVATNMPGQRNYLKQGLYRNQVIAPTGIVYHDAMTQATSLEDVLPSNPVDPDPPPDAGSPPPIDAGSPSRPDAGRPLPPDGGSSNPASSPGDSSRTRSGGLSSADAAAGTVGCSSAGASTLPRVAALGLFFLLARAVRTRSSSWPRPRN
jgi:hypothetical protein